MSTEAQLQTKNGVVIPLLGVDAVGAMVGLFCANDDSATVPKQYA
jgi:hypothetical protein